jgi:hypothetical protein
MEILYSGDTPLTTGWQAIIHLGSNIYIPLQVIAVTLSRDYEKNYADENTCTFMVPLGKYARQIYPYRTNLEITLIKAPINSLTGILDVDNPLSTERFSAVLIDKGPSVVEGQGREALDEDTLDLSQIVEIHFQLINKSTERLRMTTVGGVYRRTTVGDLLLGLLTKAASEINIDYKRIIEGIDLIEPSNLEKKEQILITQGVKLVDVPKYIQKHYGVYAADLGCFLQNNNFYIYPLYDPTHFKDRPKTLTALVLPKKKFTQVEKTYRSIGDSLVILITADTGFKDDSGTQYLNYGNGVRYANASSFLSGDTSVSDNKASVNRLTKNSEFVFDERDDGVNNVTVASNRITSNPFAIASNLIGRNGGTFKMTWENCDQSLLIPGMATKIIYFDEGEVHEIYGVLHKVINVSHKAGDWDSIKHQTHCVLTVFVNRKI